MEKRALLGKTLTELQEITSSLGLPRFTATQLADWIYKKKASGFEEMSNLSKNARDLLSEKYCIGSIAHTKVEESTDGTKKYLFPSGKNNFIEAAYIPEVLVKMRTGGISNASMKNRLLANKMDRKAWEVNGLRPYPWTLWMKPLSKINQWFLKPKF